MTADAPGRAVPPAAREWAERFADLAEVDAVALDGSWTTGTADPASDIDLAVYGDSPPAESVRRALIEPRAQHAEIGDDFFGLGDEWVEPDGQGFDVVYWTPQSMEDRLDQVLVRHEASVGYSTAFWHTLRESRCLFDRTGWFAALQQRARAPYPEQLRRAVVAKNHPVLRAKTSSYRDQVVSALQRGDRVSVQHRTTALLASWFDVLFAVNRVPHPGEKRQLQHVARLCPVRPADTDALVLAVIEASGRGSEDLLPALDRLIDALDVVLAAEGLLPS